MKKIFQIIGLISLTCFSFFMTEKTATVVNDMDEIMIEIKANKDYFKSESMNAKIEGNTIIPGIQGRKVNINKSYKNMKNSGYYSENLYVYDYFKPDISLSDNKDKYIINGNSTKRMVSLIFLVKGTEDITDILKVANNYNIKVTFFVDYAWFSNNTDSINTLIYDGHNIGILLEDYRDSSFEWMDIVIKNVNKQNNVFCYNDVENEANLTACSLKNNYTIRPFNVSQTTPLVDIKNNLSSNNLLALTNTNQLKKELSTIIIYIKSKGYTITNLEEHILE